MFIIVDSLALRRAVVAVCCRLCVGLLCDTTRTTSGLGDRLLNVLGACTVARLRGEASVSLWRSNTRLDPDRAYSRHLFVTPQGCNLAERLPARATCSLELHISTSEYGNFGPSAVLRALQNNGDGKVNVSLDDVSALYLMTARQLSLRPELATLVPTSLRSATGVHLRLGDKIVNGLNSTWQTSSEEAAMLRRRALEYTKSVIAGARGVTPQFFIVSDDVKASAAFEADVVAAGGAVIHPHTPTFAVAGLTAVLDLFRLSACETSALCCAIILERERS